MVTEQRHDPLTEQQHDALTELINIAFGRTAASLSELTGHRVELGPPDMKVLPVHEMGEAWHPFVNKEVATVHQLFKGTISGDALLMLDTDSAVALSNLLLPEGHDPARDMDASTREVLTEIGNILLSACLGMFGNLLEVQISFSVPRLAIHNLQGFLNSLVIGGEKLRYALVMTTRFRLVNEEVTGFLVIVLGVASLEQLIQATDKWAESSLHE